MELKMVKVKEKSIVKWQEGKMIKRGKERKTKVYPAYDVFEEMEKHLEAFKNFPRIKREPFDGDNIKFTGLRMRTFKNNNICVECGTKGSHFYKERNAFSNQGYHLNLYGFNKYGHEVLMTKDHIIPKALGGKDNIENLQTMCTKCNLKKGAKIVLHLNEDVLD